MSSPFTRTMRSIESEPSRRTFGRFGLLALLLGAWTAWMTCARVTVYATSIDGRLEVSRMAHKVAAQESGRVVTLRLELGRMVEKDEVLAGLDTSVETQTLAARLADLASLGPKAEAVRREIGAQQEARAWQAKVNAAALNRAHVDLREAKLVAAHQQNMSSIQTRLRDNQLASAIDELNAKKEADDSRIKAEGAAVDVSKLSVSARFDDRRTAATIADLARQLAEIEGGMKSAQAAVDETRAQIERRKVRAPIAGRLGNIDAVQVGDVLKTGDIVATIIPNDDLHVVAQLAPSEAVGRVTPGQTARVRLAGFSWAEYGMLDARVEQVASEPRDGTIRVELRLLGSSDRAIPVQHGLPGAVEIEVERVAPWVLLVRQVGGVIAPSQPASPAPSSSATSGMP